MRYRGDRDTELINKTACSIGLRLNDTFKLAGRSRSIILLKLVVYVKIKIWYETGEGIKGLTCGAYII